LEFDAVPIWAAHCRYGIPQDAAPPALPKQRPGAGDEAAYAVPLPVESDSAAFVSQEKLPWRADSSREYMQRNSGYLASPDPGAATYSEALAAPHPAEATYSKAVEFGLSQSPPPPVASTAVHTAAPPRSGEVVYASNHDYLEPTPLAGGNDRGRDITDPNYDPPTPLKLEPTYSKPHATKA